MRFLPSTMISRGIPLVFQTALLESSAKQRTLYFFYRCVRDYFKLGVARVMVILVWVVLGAVIAANHCHRADDGVDRWSIDLVQG